MDDQKRKVMILSIAATLALGAGSYIVFGGDSAEEPTSDVQKVANARIQRVGADSDPEQQRRQTRVQPPKIKKDTGKRIVRPRGSKDKPNGRQDRRSNGRIVKQRPKTRAPGC